LIDLAPGILVWIRPGAAMGREQSGRRPALVVAGEDYLNAVASLALVVPLTTVDRGWPNHVSVAGGALHSESWAMTEQLRAISRERIVAEAGVANDETLAAVRVWLRDHLEL
jgi:mRNA interferase MazF